jgi:glycosyltransferase involved in cell wall biosynthesis
MESSLQESHLLVTIYCIAYNQENYIRQCLNGFVMQKTNFHFEAIVHDDASTDHTADIIQEYTEKYPDIIKPLFETENQFSKHDGSLDRIMAAHMHGKYIAFCEGDDYWTDPLKLQKQVDFLESHLDYSICFHEVMIWNTEVQEMQNDFITRDVPESTSILELAKGNYIHTPSVVFRNNPTVFNDLRNMGDLPASDYVLWMLNAQYGAIKKIPDKMCVYRYGSGIWSGCKKDNRTKWLYVLNQLISYFYHNDEISRTLVKQYIKYVSSCSGYLDLINYYQRLQSKKIYLIYKQLSKLFKKK